MRALTLAILAGLLVPAAAGAQQKPSAPAEPGRYIVVYDRDVTSVDAETDARERRRGFRSRLRFRRAIEGFAARLSPEQVRALRADPKVEAVVADRPVHALAAQPLASGEPLAPTGVRRLGAATSTWVREVASTGVAVIDTGIDLDHPDLNAQDGIDCVTPGTSADDDDGHGTHVAGTIGAENDGAGVTGVAPGTAVHAVKVLDSNGDGTTAAIICGIDWAVANRATRNIRVLNMSLGGLGEHNRNCGREGATTVDPMHAAICRARDTGLLPVVAAGNDGWNISEFRYDVPASYPEVLTVSALADSNGAGRAAGPAACGEADETAASFSNFTLADEEKAHMIAAPGVCIRSTWLAGGYNTISGTSMATPHAAAAAALCIGEAGAAGPCVGMTPAQIVQRMRADAEAFRAANPSYGYSGDPAASPSGNYYGYLLRPVQNGPETSLASGPPPATDDSTPTFAFSSPTPGATFECSVDGGAFADCGSPHTTAPLADGPHDLAVRARDVAGTLDATPAVRAFTVDTTPDPAPGPGGGTTGGGSGTSASPPPAAPDQAGDAAAPPAAPATSPPTPVDTAPPGATVGVAKRQRIGTVSRKGLRVSVLCTEACRVDSRVIIASSSAIKLRLSKSATTAGRKGLGLGTGRRVATIKLTSTVRRRIARARSVLVQVRVLVTDAAGNARTIKRSVRLVA